MNSYMPWLYPALVTPLQFIVLLLLFALVLFLNLRVERKKRKEHKARMQEIKKMRENL